jgi:hypothetical protein
MIVQVQKYIIILKPENKTRAKSGFLQEKCGYWWIAMPRQSVLCPLFPYNTERLRHENEKCVKTLIIFIPFLA